MLERKGNRYEIYPHKVNYTQHGEVIEQWALPNKLWWEDFARLWEHTTINNFIDIDLTPEQIERFAEIQNMPEDFTQAYEEYVLTGRFVDVEHIPSTHPFQVVMLRNENNDLKNRVADLFELVLMGGAPV